MISSTAVGGAIAVVALVCRALAASPVSGDGIPMISGTAATSTLHVGIHNHSVDGRPSSAATGVSWTCSRVPHETAGEHPTANTPKASSQTICAESSGNKDAARSSDHSRQFEPPPPSLQQWSVNYLSYLGATSPSSSSPRVKFLERWAEVEGTYNHGNPYNPLDTKFGVRGDKAYNRYGVKSYPTLSAGYQATLETMRQPFDHPILAALRNPKSSVPSLALALAESNWSGFGGKSWAEQLYAAEIAHVPMRSFHLPLPTVSFRGRLVDPLGRLLADVCVSALSPTAQSRGVVTSSIGTFSLADLPRAAYRLQILDCRHVAGNEPPVYYDAKSSPHYTTSVASRATLLSAGCVGITACPPQHLNLRAPVEFGLLAPKLTWSTPAPISYGTALSSAQLDARSSVPGTYTYTRARGAVLGPGLHAIGVTFRPKDRREYSTRTSTTHLRVSRAVPPVSWRPLADITEGTPLSTAQLDATSSSAGRFVYSPGAGTVLDGGAHVLAVRFQPNDLKTYRATIERVAIVVTTSDST